MFLNSTIKPVLAINDDFFVFFSFEVIFIFENNGDKARLARPAGRPVKVFQIDRMVSLIAVGGRGIFGLSVFRKAASAYISARYRGQGTFALVVL
jgi:hypothetical protein